ncbi:MAG: DNA gyrase/topoisomerase IV subunit A, partial [Bacteroidia bacterium]
FDKYKKKLIRKITDEDLDKLTKIPMIRITRFDSMKADEFLLKIEEERKQVEFDLENLKPYQIKYYENLLKKFGKGRERKTEIKIFDTIQANTVAIANKKLYVNRVEGFVGTGLKNDEFVCECSDIDDIIVFRKDGKMQVSKVQDKAFMGKDIIYADVFRKNDDRKAYNMIYMDGKTKTSFAKRFSVLGITRDKEYDLTSENPNSKVLYFTANPNSEAETVEISLSPLSHARKLSFDFNFAELAIKGRQSVGNIVSKYLLRSVKLKQKGASTLGGRKIWYDEVIGRINVDGRGKYLGEFDTHDQILVIYKDGNYEHTNFDLTNHYEAELVLFIGKYKNNRPVSVLYHNEKEKTYYVKRFLIETQTLNKKFPCIPEGAKNRVVMATDQLNPVIILERGGGKKKNINTEDAINLTEFIDVKGWKTIGNKIAGKEFVSVVLLPPEPGTDMDDETQQVLQNDSAQLVNEDLLKEEEEKVKRLLADEPEEKKSKPKNSGKGKKVIVDQKKLF